MMGVGDSIFARIIPYILTLALSLGEHSFKKVVVVKKTKLNLTSFSYRRPQLLPVDCILGPHREN